ncbi:gliding motility-associated C-terminal domain-containing protein [Pontibacter sp. KCTC 32443]|uniref:Ig-like domain-containing protein n=1 Tax=Pontibacter TaxID=323449 RepID=UPI00164DD2D6|nr:MULTISPECIES: Ig-like domain-containing protein [Pontibacter]MBC5772968.1 gliding motility-associated C-terminal domain-containing protein [Pontibacter sp. KCTC 32443]
MEAKPSLVGAITLKWTPVANATGYVLEKSNTGDASTFSPLKSFGASENYYRHTGLYYNQKVFYRVKAVGAGDASPYSAVASATTNAQNKVFSIMPLGDSNTEGGASTVPADQMASYRAKLEKLLNGTAAKDNYDFVGSEQSGSAYLSDLDHAGMGGARNEDIVTLIRNGFYKRWYDNKNMGLDYTANYLQVFKPDVILLHIGTNDIDNNGVDNSQVTVNELEIILNEIDKYEASSGKEVTVVLAKIIKSLCNGDDCFKSSSGTKNDIIELYNNKMETLANRRIAAGDRLEFVDMGDAGIIYNYVPAGGDMADRLHPAMPGYDKMATVWFPVLDRLLNVQPPAPDTQAPETSIATKPAAQSNSKTATFSFTSNEADVVYQVSLDNAPFTNVSSPYTLNNLAEGAHTIKVRAFDKANNFDLTPATYTWTIDTQAPAAPVVLAPSEDALLNSNKPTISGTAEAGSIIKVSEGNSQIGAATTGADGKWSFVPGTAMAEGLHQLTAKATDAAGNSSSSSAVRSFSIDSKAPETIIVSNPPALTNNKAAEFKYSSNETGVTYQAGLDGAAFATVTNPVTFNNLSEGAHTLKVRAVDAAGNTDDTPATYTWTVDTTPPAPPVILAISEDRGSSSTDQITSDNTLKLKGSAEAGAKVSITLEGKGQVGTVAANASGNWEFNYEATALADGKQIFTATASDAMDNTSVASERFTVSVDQVAPEVALTTTAASPTNAPFDIKISFNEPVYGLALADFTVTNGNASNLVTIDAATYTVKITPTTDGKVTAQLSAGKVMDLAGNSNTASSVLEVTVDITKPTVALNTDAAAVVNTAFEVTINFNEEVTGFEVNDVTVSNGTASGFTKVNDTNYSVLIQPTAQGEVSVSIAADKAQDAAKNGNQQSNTIKKVYDAVAPAGYTIAFATDQVNIKNQGNISLTVSGAEINATYTYTITSSNGGEQLTGTGKVSEASFTIPSLNLSGLNDGTLTVALYLTDAVGNKGVGATAQVQKVTKDIVIVATSELIKVPFNTDFSKVPFPQKVKVTYSTGQEDYLTVTWQPGNYNAKVPAQYTLTGKLELAPNTTNFSNKTGQVIVEVQPNLPPTMLSLNTTQFKPNAEPTESIGTFSTQDPDDTDFTYTLVTGEGDDQNSYFSISNNQLYLNSNRGLSGITTFNIRVLSKDPYNNTIEKAFVLTKSAYQEKIELVNAFSPDGDGINDTWTVPELRFFNEVEITVMDKAGVQLYHSTDPEKGWDGKGRNGQVQQGPYFYIIQVKDINLVQKGVVTVLK